MIIQAPTGFPNVFQGGRSLCLGPSGPQLIIQKLGIKDDSLPMRTFAFSAIPEIILPFYERFLSGP